MGRCYEFVLIQLQLIRFWKRRCLLQAYENGINVKYISMVKNLLKSRLRICDASVLLKNEKVR